jgi:thiol-disulfide isomerase/thioredoxin
MPNLNWKKYTSAFLITVIIFITAIILSNFLNNKKLDNVREIADKIAIDIMSSETEYSLLSESSCKDVSSNTLSGELGVLAEKLTYTESNLSENNDLLRLKTYYTLLQIKDYLLMKKVSEKCNTKPVFILYFYSMNCPACEQQGYVLTYLREQYPNLRVYSFDYNIDNPALRTLISLYKVKNVTPAMVINDKVYNGFTDKDAITATLPKWLFATSTATSTKATSTSPKK